MAQSLNIYIRVKEAGFEIIDDFIKKLNELKGTLDNIKIAPLEDFAERIKDVGGAFKETKDAVKDIRNTLKDAVSSVAKQAVDEAGGTFGRIERDAAASFEKIYSRTISVGMGIIALSFSKKFFDVTAIMLARGISVIKKITIAGNATLEGFSALLWDLFSIIEGINSIAESIFIKFGGGILARFSSFLTRLTLFSGTLIMYRTFFSEATILFKRLIGRGTMTLTPLERASRYITTIDIGVHSISLKAGHLIKNLVLGIATFSGPFSGIIAGIPFINSLVDTLLAVGTRVRLKVLTFFGSSRAQLSLIVLNLKDILSNILPAILLLTQKLITPHSTRRFLKIGAYFGSTKAKVILGLINIKDIIIKTFLLMSEWFDKLNNSLDKLLTAKKINRFYVGLQKVGSSLKVIAVIKSIIAYFRDLKKVLDEINYYIKKFFEWLEKLKGKTGIIIRSIIIYFWDVKKVLENILSFGEKRLKIGTELKLIPKVLDTTKEKTRQVKQVYSELYLEVEKALRAILNISKAKYTGGRILPEKGGIATLSAFINTLQRFFLGKKGYLESVIKTFVRLDIIFASLQKSVKTGTAQDMRKLYDVLGEFPKKVRSSKIKVDVDIIKKAFEEFAKAVHGTKGKLEKEQIAETSTLFVTRYTEAFKKGNKEFQPVLDAFIKLLLAFFSKVEKSGEKIPSQLAGGMKKAKDKIANATEEITKEVADRLPRSLPRKGVLRRLITAGIKIPLLLARGMKKGIGYVVSAANLMVRAIMNPFDLLGSLGGKISSVFSGLSSVAQKNIEDAAKLGHMAERVGISVDKLAMFKNVLAEVGEDVESLSFVFSRMNRTLGKTYSAEEQAKIEKLGIDLEAVKESSDPVLTLFLEVADVIKRVPAGSEEAAQALQLIGVTASSKVINVLKLGSKEIRKLMKEGIDLGLVYNKKFVEFSRGFSALKTRIANIRDFLINNFVEVVGPEFIKLGKVVLDWFKKNRIRVQATIQFIAQAVIAIMRFVGSFIEFATRKPKKAVQILAKVFQAFFGFVIRLVGQGIDIIKGDVGNFLIDIALFLFSFLIKIAKEIFAEITDIIGRLKPIILKAWKKMGIELLAFFKKLGESLANIGEGILEALYRISKLGSKKIFSFIKLKFLEFSKWFHQKILENYDLFNWFGLPGDKLRIEAARAILDINAVIKDLNLKEKANKVTEEVMEPIRNAFNEILDWYDKIGKPPKEPPPPKPSWAEKIKRIAAESKDAVEKLRESAEKAGEDFFSQEQLDKFKSNLQQMTEEIKSVFAGTELEGDFDLVGKIFSEEKYNEIVERLERVKDKAKDMLKEIAITSAETAGGKFKKILLEKIEEIKKSNALGKMEGIFSSLYELSKKKAKEFFYAEKAIAIAKATMNIAEAITKAWTLGPWGGFLQGIIAAEGAVQIATILAQSPGFAKGGEVKGKEGTDNILIRATRGEYVQPREAVSYYGARLMEAIRTKALPKGLLENLVSNMPNVVYTPPTPKYQAGGFVAQTQQDIAQPQEPITIVNVQDKDELGAYLASTAGRRVLLNVLAGESAELKGIVLET